MFPPHTPRPDITNYYAYINYRYINRRTIFKSHEGELDDDADGEEDGVDDEKKTAVHTGRHELD